MQQYPPDGQPSASRAPFFDGTQACAGAPLDLFFASRGGDVRAKTRAAKAICAHCRFLTSCLTYATARGMVGVWGGTTEGERLGRGRGRRRIHHPAAVAS